MSCYGDSFIHLNISNTFEYKSFDLKGPHTRSSNKKGVRFNLTETASFATLKFLNVSTGTTLRDNCIQNFHLGRYIVGYTVRNLILRRRASRAVKRDFQTYIQRYTSANTNFEYGYPHSNALLQCRLKLERYKPLKAIQRPTSSIKMWHN